MTTIILLLAAFWPITLVAIVMTVDWLIKRFNPRRGIDWYRWEQDHAYRTKGEINTWRAIQEIKNEQVKGDDGFQLQPLRLAA